MQPYVQCKHTGRWHHGSDRAHSGPSVSNAEYARGHRPVSLPHAQAPAPQTQPRRLVTTQATPQPQPPRTTQAPPRPRTMTEAEKRQAVLTFLTKDVPPQPKTLDLVLEIQRQQGKR